MANVDNTEVQKSLAKMEVTINGIGEIVSIIGSLCIFAYVNSYIGLTPNGLRPLQNALWFSGLFIATQFAAAFLSVVISVTFGGTQLMVTNWKGSFMETREVLDSIQVELQKRREEAQKQPKKSKFPRVLLSNLLLCLMAFWRWEPFLISIVAVALVVLNIYVAERIRRKAT
jgi:hypothetical protein